MPQPEVTMQPPSDITLAAPSRVKVKFCGICTRRDLDAAGKRRSRGG